MKTIKCEGIKIHNGSKTRKECLLREANILSKPGSSSFKEGQITWEASTLPLSYTRQNHTYFSLKNHACKERVLASSNSGTDISSLLYGYQLCAATEGKSSSFRTTRSTN